MTQTTDSTTRSFFPLPDVFSIALTQMFNTVQPSIVQVRTQGRGAGTGIVWYADGRIITNNHVVADDRAHVQVLLSDSRTLDAKVLARNPRLDLALLKVNADDLQPLTAGDSAQLRVGEWVFAIGHPWGQRWVLTAGIFSRMSTAKFDDGTTTQYIQSDVRLAPGNSGGPLLDADGNVIGINAMIFGGDLSVAIPSNVVTKWLAGLPKRRVTLGIEIQTVEVPVTIGQILAPQRSTGVLVVGVRPERQAKHQDLFIGDILLEVAGKPIKDNAALLQTLAQSEESATITVKLLRGGEVVTLTIGMLL